MGGRKSASSCAGSAEVCPSACHADPHGQTDGGCDSSRGQGPGPEQAKGQAGGSRWRQRKQRVNGQDRSPGCSSALGASVSLSVTWWTEGHALIGSYFHGVTLGKCQACLCLNFFICPMGLINKSDCFWVDHQDRVRSCSARHLVGR